MRHIAHYPGQHAHPLLSKQGASIMDQQADEQDKNRSSDAYAIIVMYLTATEGVYDSGYTHESAAAAISMANDEGRYQELLEDARAWLSSDTTASRKTASQWWVNGYDVYRMDGGPEEGGWWYDDYTPTGEQWGPFSSREEAEEKYYELQSTVVDPRNEGAWPLHSSNSLGLFTVRIENHMPRRDPETRPRYSSRKTANSIQSGVAGVDEHVHDALVALDEAKWAAFSQRNSDPRGQLVYEQVLNAIEGVVDALNIYPWARVSSRKTAEMSSSKHRYWRSKGYNIGAKVVANGYEPSDGDIEPLDGQFPGDSIPDVFGDDSDVDDLGGTLEEAIEAYEEGWWEAVEAARWDSDY